MARQLSDGYIVRSFLQLDDLLINELALLVNDKVRIEGTLCRVFAWLGGASAGTWQRHTGKAAGDSDVL